MAKERPYHFDMLKRLFYNADGSIKKTWGTLTLATKVRHKWPRLREYCASITDSGKYGELRYLLDHNWEYKKCLICGKPTKWAGGYEFHDYCSSKCAGIASNTEESNKRRKLTRKTHKTELLSITPTWTLESLQEHDGEMLSLLVDYEDNGKLHFTKLFRTLKVTHNKKYVNYIFWLNNRISWAKQWSETIVCVYKHITEQPMCKTCRKKPTTFDNLTHEYRKFCSAKCGVNDNERKDKQRQWNKEHYEEIQAWLKNARDRKTEQEKINERNNKCITMIIRNGGLEAAYINRARKGSQTNLILGGNKCSLHRTDIKGTYKTPKPSLDSIALGASKLSALYNSDPQYGIDLSEILRYTWVLKGKDGRKAAIEGYRQWYYSGGIERILQQKKKRSEGVKKWNDNKTPQQKEEEFHRRIYGMLITWLDSVATYEDLQELGIASVNDVNKEWWASQSKLYKERVYGFICHTSKRGKVRSQEENDLYTYILARFPDVKRDYPTEQYPWRCDFYIPSIDTYIEYNGYPTHGKHPYDIDSEEDNEIVNNWIEKGLKNYVYNWTISDVLKRCTAYENNLNYYECWAVEEAEQLINNLYENLHK